MRKLIYLCLIVAGLPVLAQAQRKTKMIEKKSADGKYTYLVAANDPLGVRQYTLSNGLTVLTSVNKAEPRIQTFIAVKAGSKNDPATHTGLAHYLEHMLFKGTDKFGTQDYATEKKYLDQIDDLYEQYNQTKDDTKRAEIYRRIDSVSGIAAKYAIANEYDKLLQGIGATGTNAFTSVEQTVYINNIPSNQLTNWLTIEAERFRNPVFRIFHTELEAVYEEKNRGLDNDDVKVDEALMAGLFRKHPYGTQTTIGTIEHLKNPSLKEIRKYYNTYYVPNNMAVIIAGDFDPDQAIVLIDQHFGKMARKDVPSFSFKPEETRTAPAEFTVLGPKAEQVQIGFRFPGAGTSEALKLRILSSLLYNGKAGLIDLNLLKTQKLLDGWADIASYKDYSFMLIQGQPAEGQKLEDVRKLLLEQVSNIKSGNFDDKLLTAIVNNLEAQQVTRLENNSSRVFLMLDAFATGRNWQDVVNEIEELRKLKKADIVAFANLWMKDDYVVVYKKTGEDKSITKVPKPTITPVEINREAVSPFAQAIAKEKVSPLQPVFLDYAKDISRVSLSNNAPLFYLKNNENKRFTMYYMLDMGKNNDKRLPIAANYLEYLGTDKYSAEEISKEFYRLACTFGVSSGNDRTYIYLSGLQDNYEEAVKLLEHLMANAKPDEKALATMLGNTIQARENQMKDPNVILRSAMMNYAKFGPQNPFNNNLKNEDLKKLRAEELVNILKGLTGYEHKVYYYGPAEQTAVKGMLDKLHTGPAGLKPVPAGINFTAQTPAENKVLFVDFDMVQANILWVRNAGPYRPEVVPAASLFNEYFGGGMGSIVFQTLREAKALAYSTSSRFEFPTRKEDPFFTVSYIGTQSDKLNEAIGGMNELLTTMPETEVLLDNAKKGLQSQLEAQRIIRQDILLSYDQAMRLGVNYDLRKDTYAQLPGMNMKTLKEFHGKYFAKGVTTYSVLASKDKVSLNDLKKYGTPVTVTLQELFGY